jgi:hypothetical protein
MATVTETHYYIECPNCEGPQGVHQACGHTEYRGQRGFLFGCKGCNQFVVIQKGQFRRIDIRTRSLRLTDQCNGVCLNGKKTCDCKCRGRCHGAGKCFCGEVVA